MIQLAKLYLQTGDLEMCQQYCMLVLKQASTEEHDAASMVKYSVLAIL